MKLRESVLQWLRLIQDNEGWLDQDERMPEMPIFPRTMRRHLLRMGYISETRYSDGSWRVDITERGKRARRTELLC